MLAFKPGTTKKRSLPAYNKITKKPFIFMIIILGTIAMLRLEEDHAPAFRSLCGLQRRLATFESGDDTPAGHHREQCWAPRLAHCQVSGRGDSRLNVNYMHLSVKTNDRITYQAWGQGG